MIQTLDVYLWGQRAGKLCAYKDKYVEKACFYYDKNFVNGGIDPSPLHNSVSSAAAKNGLPIYAESDKLYCGLPAFISDSLPDHWGNKLFAEWARAKGIKLKSISSLDRLAYIGKRGMGAIEFYPSSEPSLETGVKVNVNDLFEQSKLALKSASDFRVSSLNELVVESLFRVGTSAGGRRPKALININLDSGIAFSGQVPPPSQEYVPSIIKFDEDGQWPSTRVEYSYYTMAKEAGMAMQPSALIEASDKAHFLTKRFDRVDAEKLHVQTLAAISPGANTYEDLLETTMRLNVAPSYLRDVFRAMVMNVVCGNTDDHNKNFSFIMDKGGIWRVSPTYDFTFTVDPSAPNYVNGQSMTINGKASEISRADFVEIAERFSIRNPHGIIDECIAAATNYLSHGEKAGLDEKTCITVNDEIIRRIEALDPPHRGYKR